MIRLGIKTFRKEFLCKQFVRIVIQSLVITTSAQEDIRSIVLLSALGHFVAIVTT